MMLLLRWQCCR